MGLDLHPGRPDGPLPSDPHAAWPYSAFSHFRAALATHIGINLGDMVGFGGKRSWDTVHSPLKHLLDHSDCDGELTPQQAGELAPELQHALNTLAVQEGSPLSRYDVENGQVLVDLLVLCAFETLPVVFC